jgi:hypothetical protein
MDEHILLVKVKELKVVYDNAKTMNAITKIKNKTKQ